MAPIGFTNNLEFKIHLHIQDQNTLETFAKLGGSGLRPATLFKKRLWHRRCPEKIAKFLRAPYSIELCRWLILNV